MLVSTGKILILQAYASTLTTHEILVTHILRYEIHELSMAMNLRCRTRVNSNKNVRTQLHSRVNLLIS